MVLAIGDEKYDDLKLKAKSVMKMPSWRKDEIRQGQVDRIAAGTCGPAFNPKWEPYDG